MDPTLIYPASILMGAVLNSATRSFELWKAPDRSKTNQNIAYELRLKEFETTHRQRLLEMEQSSGQRREEIAFAEMLRSTHAIHASTAIRRSAKSDENDPFLDGADSTYEKLREIYCQTGKPIVLIAPFWDTVRTKKANDEGGFVDFRTALNFRYGKASWNDSALKHDGYFKRPLYNTDRDINYILDSLPDLPIILVHGTIQGVHGPAQHVQRIHPTITFWNLLPDKQENYLNLQLEFFTFDPPLENTKEFAKYSHQLQDLVGDYISKLIGISSTAYYLYRDGTCPDLTKFEGKGSLELEILTYQMSSLYDLLCEREPDKSNHYQMERKIMLERHGISEQAIDEEVIKNMEYENSHSSPAEIRCWFAQQLKEMSKTLDKAKSTVSSGSLDLTDVLNSLEDKSSKLEEGTFKFLIVGDFNRGKSTILNVFLGKENLLPVGPTATTAFPIYVKFGQAERVVVHYKNKSAEEITLKDFKEKFARNSNLVKKQIQKLNNSVGEWLKPFDRAEIYLPLKLLEQGIEFIDTAGLNHNIDEDNSTLERIGDCHAIFFVLSADDQLTASEEVYLKNHVKGKVNSVFFLINKWENLIDEGDSMVSQDKYEEVREEFVDRLSACLDVEGEEIRNWWGRKIFDIYAKKASQKLSSEKSLEGTGFPDFLEVVNKFLSEGRLMAELFPAYASVEAAYQTVSTVLKSLIATVGDKPEELRLKIEASNPHFEYMRDTCTSLKKSIDLQKKYTVSEVSESYRQFCQEFIHDFDSKFNLPDPESLGAEKRNEYAEKIAESFRKFQQDSLDNWNAKTKASILIKFNELNEEILTSLDRYNARQKTINDILSQELDAVGRVQQMKVYQGQSAAESELTASNANPVAKMLVGATAGLAVVGFGGVGVAGLTHAFLWLANPVTGAFIALTPLGWGLAAGTAVSTVAAAFWGRQSEVKKFREAMKQKLKDLLPEMTSDKHMSVIKDNIASLFDNFIEIPQQMERDVNSLEQSLKTLLDSKEKAETDSKTEKEALERLGAKFSTQWQNINERYQKLKKNSEASI